jgi:hypothetical protein
MPSWVLPPSRIAAVLVVLVALGVGLAWAWGRAFHHYDRAPELAPVPKRTENARHVPGDPINVALVGSFDEMRGAFLSAGWAVAAPLSLRSDIAIARSVLRDRPDSSAPVSRLFLFGRMEDVAFEREVGRSATHRHHVRFWQAPDLTIQGRPVWLGAATFDAGVGLSHRGFHPTHHIARDIDAERDTVLADLAATGRLAERFSVTGIGPVIGGRNAEGDPFDTDGELAVAIVRPSGAAGGPPSVASAPLPALWKNQVWRWASGAAGTVRAAAADSTSAQP